MGTHRLAKGGKRPQGNTPEPTFEQQLEDCLRIIKAPEIDWDEAYLRVRCSPIGSDFPRDRFLRTPCNVLTRLLNFIDSEEQRLANVQSASVAMLGVQMAYIAWGFSGSKGKKPKVDLKDFLPFPDWKPPTIDTQTEGPSPATKLVLTRLVRERRIPVHVFTALNSAPERDP